MVTAGRWPPVYDADELASQIAEIATDRDLAGRLYDLTDVGGLVCQGDVVELAAGVPVLDESGAAVTEEDATHWLVIGNTCDFDRDIEDVPWTQVVPLIDLGTDPSDAQIRD